MRRLEEQLHDGDNQNSNEGSRGAERTIVFKEEGVGVGGLFDHIFIGVDDESPEGGDFDVAAQVPQIACLLKRYTDLDENVIVLFMKLCVH